MPDLEEMLTPTDIMNHLKLGRNKTYELIRLSNFPKIKIGNTYRIPKDKYINGCPTTYEKQYIFNKNGSHIVMICSLSLVYNSRFIASDLCLFIMCR